MLEIHKLQKVFHAGSQYEKKAIRKFSLSVPEGEFVTIIGGNGAGKSTLMNLIAGTFLPDSGYVHLGDEDITYFPEYKRSKRIGHLFQDPLYGTAPGMTIEENLSLAFLRGKRRGLYKAVKKSNVTLFQEQLKMLDLGLEDRLKTKMGTLSGGQRQAITLLMATIATPRLLLLDEHTAALDPVTAQKVLELTKKIVREHGITTLMITHNMQSALDCGDRTLMLQDGSILLDINGAERKSMTVQGLLEKFQEKSGENLNNDRMLIG